MLDDELLSRLQRKKLRATAGKLEEKRQLKLKKLRAQSQGASGAYASGASDQAIERAVRQLRKGVDTEQVLHQMANELTQKLLHQPTVQLREWIETSENFMTPSAHSVLESVE